MNMHCLYWILGISILAGSMCTDSVSPEKKKELQGRWVEVYTCDNNKCDYPQDTIHTSVITFNKSSFTTEFYNDSGQNAQLDTIFSGTYYLSQDSLELRLKNFDEKFFYQIADTALYLTAAYSIDLNGNVIIDFRSVLWCCDKQKSGRFIRN